MLLIGAKEDKAFFPPTKDCVTYVGYPLSKKQELIIFVWGRVYIPVKVLQGYLSLLLERKV